MASQQVALYRIIIAIRIVAATLSFVIVLALSIPLFLQLKNGTFHQSAAQQRRRNQDPPPYSTYNLYLVYLGLVDLVYLLSTMQETACTAKELCFLTDTTVTQPYIIANMWINSVIAYEVWRLLRATQQRQKIAPPSLTRVHLQSGGVIFGSLVYGIFQYYVGMSGMVYAVASLLAYLPFMYSVGVTIFIKCRGYMPAANGSTSIRDRAVRGLALYFFRIVIVFLSIWFPAGVLGSLLYVFGLDSRQSSILSMVGALLLAVQPILTFWMSLGKDDVKRYVQDFVTLTYLHKSCTGCRRNAEANDTTEDPEVANELPGRRKSTNMVLGYNFEDDNDDDANDNAIGNTFASANDVIDEQEVDPKSNAFVGECNAVASMVDADENDEEPTPMPLYKSRRIREGPAVTVMAATGQAYHISLRQEDQTKEL